MEINNQIHNLKYLKDVRKELRNGATASERLLWMFLRDRQLKGKKFRRQHSIDHFIVDFYCADLRLAIEIDGGIHKLREVQLNDKEKEGILDFYNIRLLRFTNEEVLDDIEKVLLKIEQSL
ncbi:MAG: hypothetical protein JWN78_2824 [Bacteroidota bacterium]|nr:hypothetical protein [Bacteroidota bacterium]